AIIGLGVGEQHIAGYRAHPGAEVVAVCDIDPAKLAMAAERYPDLRRTGDARELLLDPEIDVVSVASYDDAHFEQIRLALSHGKHVFAEKPLVLSARDATEVAGLLRAHPELRLSSNLPLRLSPRFVRVRELIAAGELGELFHLEGDYDYGRPHKLTDGWRGQIPYYSVMLGGGIHLVDLLTWMSGLRVVEVMAASGNGIATAGTAFAHPSFVTTLLRTDAGPLIKINANLGSVCRHFHAVRIYGTDGTFINGLPDGVLYRATQAPQEGIPSTVDDPYPGVAKGDLIESFVESILTGADARVTAGDAFASLSVCLAVERALAGGRPVPVEYLL
ncbi:MAG: Gfo/Idh/MocA family protein, partial [Trebonia sp.]